MSAQSAEPEPPLILYHYTTLAGACGIVGTQRLWATSIRHLNDSTEFTYAHRVLREELEGATRGTAAGVSAAVGVYGELPGCVSALGGIEFHGKVWNDVRGLLVK